MLKQLLAASIIVVLSITAVFANTLENLRGDLEYMLSEEPLTTLQYKRARAAIEKQYHGRSIGQFARPLREQIWPAEEKINKFLLAQKKADKLCKVRKDLQQAGITTFNTNIKRDIYPFVIQKIIGMACTAESYEVVKKAGLIELHIEGQVASSKFNSYVVYRFVKTGYSVAAYDKNGPAQKVEYYTIDSADYLTWNNNGEWVRSNGAEARRLSDSTIRTELYLTDDFKMPLLGDHILVDAIKLEEFEAIAVDTVKLYDELYAVAPEFEKFVEDLRVNVDLSETPKYLHDQYERPWKEGYLREFMSSKEFAMQWLAEYEAVLEKRAAVQEELNKKSFFNW